jgi:glycosyltransferase involved in cell wall biosynthesis
MGLEKPEVTLLLTAYNEADTIENVIREYYGEIGEKIPLKILVVEDGSTDGTKEILGKLSKEFPIDLLLGEERRGYSKAVVEGLRHVKTESVFFTDGDGQHRAEDFWKLFGLESKYDVISGWRVERADALHRKVMSKVFQWMARVLFGLPKFHDITAPYKLMRSDAAKIIAKDWRYMKESFWTEFTIRAHIKGFNILEVPVIHRSRMGGGSTSVYKLWKIPKIAFSQIEAMLKLWSENKGGKSK